MLRDWGGAGPRDLDEQMRRDELQNLMIAVCRDGAGEWLVRAISWLGAEDSPPDFRHSGEGAQLHCWTEGLFPSGRKCCRLALGTIRTEKVG